MLGVETSDSFGCHKVPKQHSIASLESSSLSDIRVLNPRSIVIQEYNVKLQEERDHGVVGI